MIKAWFKNISILLIALFLLVDSNMIKTMSAFFKIAALDEISIKNIDHEDEPAETNPTEKIFEKSEFIVDDLSSLINPISFFISSSYTLVYSKNCVNRPFSVLTPPPNIV